MTEDELREIEARVDAATPGPWEGIRSQDAPKVWRCGDLVDLTADDAAFIAHAREDVPALVAEVRRLQEEDVRLRDLVELLGKQAVAMTAIVDRLPRTADGVPVVQGTNLWFNHEGYACPQLWVAGSASGSFQVADEWIQVRDCYSTREAAEAAAECAVECADVVEELARESIERWERKKKTLDESEG